MRKLLAICAAAALAGAAWMATNRIEIEGWDRLRFKPRGSTAQDGSAPATDVAQQRQGDANLRIATFHVEVKADKANDSSLLERLAEIVSRYDVVALQGVGSPAEDFLLRLLDALNAGGKQYEYLTDAQPGLAGGDTSAFVFDTARLETDRTEMYTVNDPHNLLRRDPLVAWFRTRGVSPAAAFTFTLVNVHVDAARTEAELTVLADVFGRVRADGRQEDDVILLGDFNAGDKELGPVGDLPRIACAIADLPTRTRGEVQSDNLVFDSRATNEFAGQVGVFDFLREFNWSMQDSLEISGHLPVWAEFSVYEGGRIARRD